MRSCDCLQGLQLHLFVNVDQLVNISQHSHFEICEFGGLLFYHLIRRFGAAVQRICRIKNSENKRITPNQNSGPV